MRKPFWKGFWAGIISNLIFFLSCVYLSSINHPLFKNNDPMPNTAVYYFLLYSVIAIVSFFVKKSFAFGLLVALSIPVMIFVLLQVLVILSYRGVIH